MVLLHNTSNGYTISSRYRHVDYNILEHQKGNVDSCIEFIRLERPLISEFKSVKDERQC